MWWWWYRRFEFSANDVLDTITTIKYTSSSF